MCTVNEGTLSPKKSHNKALRWVHQRCDDYIHTMFVLWEMVEPQLVKSVFPVRGPFVKTKKGVVKQMLSLP